MVCAGVVSSEVLFAKLGGSVFSFTLVSALFPVSLASSMCTYLHVAGCSPCFWLAGDICSETGAQGQAVDPAAAAAVRDGASVQASRPRDQPHKTPLQVTCALHSCFSFWDEVDPSLGQFWSRFSTCWPAACCFRDESSPPVFVTRSCSLAISTAPRNVRSFHGLLRNVFCLRHLLASLRLQQKPKRLCRRGGTIQFPNAPLRVRSLDVFHILVRRGSGILLARL